MTRRAAELAGIKRVLDDLGADLGGELVVSYVRPDRLSMGQMVRARAAVDRAADVKPRWPGGSLAGQASFVVLGASPSPDDQGVAWSGRSGRFMRAELAGAGVDVSTVAFLNLVGETTTEAPEQPILTKWRQWHLDAMVAADARYAIFMGAHATGAWRTDVGLTQVQLSRPGAGVGIWRIRNRHILVGSLASPLAVMRDRLMLETWRKGVAKWAGIVGEDRQLDAVGRACVYKHCDESAWGYDQDGVPWCRAHWNPDGPEKTRNKWVNKHEGQEVML